MNTQCSILAFFLRLIRDCYTFELTELDVLRNEWTSLHKVRSPGLRENLYCVALCCASRIILCDEIINVRLAP